LCSPTNIPRLGLLRRRAQGGGSRGRPQLRPPCRRSGLATTKERREEGKEEGLDGGRKGGREGGREGGAYLELGVEGLAFYAGVLVGVLLDVDGGGAVGLTWREGGREEGREGGRMSEKSRKDANFKVPILIFSEIFPLPSLPPSIPPLHLLRT
jgi:hypothetical protein